MDAGTEVSQSHQRFQPRVDDFHSTCRSLRRNEHLVTRLLAETDHRRSLQRQFSHASSTLDRDPAAGPRILQQTLSTGLHRQLLGAEELLTIDRAVDNPAVGMALAALPIVHDRFKVIVLLEMRVDVLLPIELADDEVQIVVLLGRHVLDQQRPGHLACLRPAIGTCRRRRFPTAARTCRANRAHEAHRAESASRCRA